MAQVLPENFQVSNNTQEICCLSSSTTESSNSPLISFAAGSSSAATQKIQARLLGGSAKIWKTDPVTVINQWTPNERDRRTFQTYALSSRGQRKTTLKVNPVEMRSISKSDVGLLAHSGPDINGDFEFMFNIEDSSAWLRLVGRCIVRLRNMLLIQTDTTLKWKPDPIDDVDLLRVDYYLRFLQLLLDFPAIKWLFSDSSLKFCFELKRSPGMPLHDQSHSYD